MTLIHCNQLQLPINLGKDQTVASCEPFISLGKYNENPTISECL